MTADASAAAPGGTEGAAVSDDDAQAALAEAAQQLATEGMTPEQQIAALQAESEKWKGLARKHEDRSKANVAAARELADLKKAQMTDLEREKTTRTEAEARAANAEAALLRSELARAYRLDDDLVPLLGTGTEEELTARAELLASKINRSGATGAEGQLGAAGAALQSMVSQGNAPGSAGAAGRILAGTRPVESLRPGALPASTSARPKDSNAMFREMLDRNQ